MDGEQGEPSHPTFQITIEGESGAIAEDWALRMCPRMSSPAQTSFVTTFFHVAGFPEAVQMYRLAPFITISPFLCSPVGFPGFRWGGR